MNQDILEMLAVAAVFGVLLGPRLARSAARRAPIYGGAAARALHLLAAVAMTGLLPGVLAGVVLGIPFLTTFGIAMGLLAACFALLLAFAMLESPARPAPQPAEDRGWTAEDARRSGM